MRVTRQRLVALVVAALAVTAGCTGANTGAADGGGDGFQAGDSGDLEREAEGEPMAATRTPMATAAGDGGAGGGSADYEAQQFVERQRILTGEVALEVEDFEAARANLTRVTERHGGFVSDARVDVDRIGNESRITGVVVLRVPRDNYTALFERVKDEGELLGEDQQSQDVTEQLVDLEARLENLRAERDQLRVLYDRANTTEDVLAVQRRLSDVQGEIERLEARQQSLQRQVALSTITVRLREPRPDRPLPDQWYDVPLVTAFLESVDGVVVTLRAIAVAGAYAVPYVLAFGVPLAAVGYVFRRRRGPRPPGGLRGRLARGGGGEAEGPPDEGPDDEAGGDGGVADTDSPDDGVANTDSPDDGGAAADDTQEPTADAADTDDDGSARDEDE